MPDTKRKIAGADVLLKVKKGDTEYVVAGQQGSTLNMSADTIDVTDKTSGGWRTSMAGLKEWSIDNDVFYTIGDESNKLLLDAFVNAETITATIRVGNDDEVGGTTFEGEAYITDFPMDFAMDNAVSVSMGLSGASALQIVHGVVAP